MVILTSGRYFWNYKNSVRFVKKAISGKIIADFQSFKTSSRSPKWTSFDPPNVLNKWLSRNPILIRRCEVNKFNLVTLYKYEPYDSLITQFSRPRAVTIFSSFCFYFFFFSLQTNCWLFIEDSSINSSFTSRFKFQDCKFRILV